MSSKETNRNGRRQNDKPTPTIEEILNEHQLPHQKALIDFDINDPTEQALGTDPIDLTKIPIEPVKSLITPTAVLTIYAHQGEEQDVAELLHANGKVVDMVQDHAQYYQERNVWSFAINALTEQQIENIKRHAKYSRKD